MKKQDIALRLARKARVSRAAAADRLDRLVHDILSELRRGNQVSLPGLGTFTPGKRLRFEFNTGRPKGGLRSDKKR
jgi:nucleoid DNA-binding protein